MLGSKGPHLSMLGGFTCVSHPPLLSAYINAVAIPTSPPKEQSLLAALQHLLKRRPELQRCFPAQGKSGFWLLVTNVICHSAIWWFLGKVFVPLFSNIVKKKKIISSVNVSGLPVFSLLHLLNAFSSSNRTARVQPQISFSRTAFSLGKSSAQLK